MVSSRVEAPRRGKAPLTAHAGIPLRASASEILVVFSGSGSQEPAAMRLCALLCPPSWCRRSRFTEPGCLRTVLCGQRLAGACSSASLPPSCPLVRGGSQAAIHMSHLRVSAPGQTQSPPSPHELLNLQVVAGGTSLARYRAGRPQRPPPQAS
jgi:hypothetical protein